MRNKIVLAAFILVAGAQIYVPANMILHRENILGTGMQYKFRTAPIDPYDPFIGKYIVLSYRENTFQVKNGSNWTEGETVYVSFMAGNDGFAKIKSVSKKRPAGQPYYLKSEVSFVTDDSSTILTLDYPFDRYYMEESKAFDAEQTYRESQLDTTKITYALVSIKNGDAVLKDVFIDGTSIREIVKSNQRNRK